MTKADRPSPYELWQMTSGDRDEYRRLLREHGHLVDRQPGDDPNLPCGWPGSRIKEGRSMSFTTHDITAPDVQGLVDENARMRTVVEAAQEWRRWFPLADSMFASENALIVAVDAYEVYAKTSAKFSCASCGPIAAADIYLLNWESTHGDERCQRCGGGDLVIPMPSEATDATAERSA